MTFSGQKVWMNMQYDSQVEATCGLDRRSKFKFRLIGSIIGVMFSRNTTVLYANAMSIKK